MNLSIGIIGLPNVGKSTLFNALLKKQSTFAKASADKQALVDGVAKVGNYPFTTIEPNVGIVPVPDERLVRLAEATKTEHKMESLPPMIPAVVRFVDIAGLVKGASEGAGLGNKFLSHIREASVIAHVVRAFEDSNIVREGSVGPKQDYETINTELALADLQTIENSKFKSKNSKLQFKIQNDFLDRLSSHLNNGQPVRNFEFREQEKEFVDSLFLLTNKPEIVVLNVSEESYNPSSIQSITGEYEKLLGVSSQKLVVISAKIESELAGLTPEEQKEYLSDLGLEESGLERLIQKAYAELGLISFLTAGEKEVRAWTIRRGSTALIAAGEIHTDFMKKFIKAEVVKFDDFVKFGGWKGAREHGKEILEGKDYVVRDGDVIEFKIGL